MIDDLYALLDVAPTASFEEIKERFRFLAHAYHPDKFASLPHKQQAEEHFKKINAAYQILSDPEKRAAYDYRAQSDTKPPPIEHQRELNEIDQAILSVTQEIEQLTVQIPKPSTASAIFAVLFIGFGINPVIFGLLENDLLPFLLGLTLMLAGVGLLVRRNRFYDTHCRPLLQQVAKKRVELQQLQQAREQLLQTRR